MLIGMVLNVPDEKGGDIVRFVYIISIPSMNYAISPTVQGGLTGFCTEDGMILQGDPYTCGIIGVATRQYCGAPESKQTLHRHRPNGSPCESEN